MGFKKNYDEELKKYEAAVELQESAEAPEWWPLLEMIRLELRYLIFGENETPNWWNVIWNLGKIVAKIVALLFIEEKAHQQYNTLKQAYKTKKSKPSTKDG